MTSDVPKATLYTFEGSVWASSPRLCLIEKGYSPSDVDLKTVNLILAENFDPSYLRINSKGTVPTLVVPLLETTSAEVDTKFRALTDAKSILEFLDKSRSPLSSAEGSSPAPILAPATIEGKAASDELIKLVHGENVDPNFLLLGARNEEEFKKGAGGLPGTFVANRNRVLLEQQKVLAENNGATTAFDGSTNPKSSAVHENLKKWYADKIASQTLLTKAYIENDQESISQLITATNGVWKNIATLMGVLEGKIQGPFALGDQISLADLHLIPWLARVAAVASGIVGGGEAMESLDKVLQGFGGKVGDKVKAFWTAFGERPSFKEVYGQGLH